MEQVLQYMGNSTDAIILKELFQAFQDIQCNTWKMWGKTISSAFLKGLLLFFLQSQLKGEMNFLTLLKNLLKIVLYKKKRYYLNKANADLYIGNRFKNLNGHVNRSFQMDITNGKDYVDVEFLPFIHSSFIKETEYLGTQDAEKNIDAFQYMDLSLQGGKTCVGSDILFCSRNFQKLEGVLRKHFEMSKRFQSRNTLGILINGEPGLGKSKSIDYLTRCNFIDQIIKIDMTENMGAYFSQLKEQINDDRVDNAVVMIDEIDKWLDFKVKQQFKLQFEHSEEGKKGENGELLKKLLPSSSGYVEEDIEVFRRDFTEQFLYQVLSLLETRYSTKSMVFIFCSNNFETIFSNVDKKHFDSLEKRFLKLRFEPCGMEELKDYVWYLNEKMKGSEEEVAEKDLELMLSRVRPDFSLPYRYLNQTLISVQYQLEAFLREIQVEFEKHKEEEKDVECDDGGEKGKKDVEMNENVEKKRCEE